MLKETVVLAADVGGSHITLALVVKGHVMDSVTIKAEPIKGMRAYLPLMEQMAKQLVENNSLSFLDLAGFGMALPMLVDSKKNTVLSCANNKYEDAVEIDFEQWAREKFGLQIRLEVDGNLGCMGEWNYGAGKGVQDLVYVILGTGYGSSVVLGGQPLRGRNFTAGILAGHMVVNPMGSKCICPGNGCVESETGTWALPGIARKTEGFHTSLLAKREKIDYAALFEDHALNDSVAIKILERSIMYWGASLVNLIYAYNPQKIIMAGSVIKAGDYIIPRLDAYIKKQLWTIGEYPEICKAQHFDTAALLGCYSLVTTSDEYE
ncbi:hypothetical protein B4Q04_10845 [Zobellia sp. OII3]|uniref:ROK family protein n=1 Tax=Zobellia sp. OII3 TaxID=2034520 RepID=UPI000B52BA8D|nr:ROK family protein [Zobellia sp. OII3]OWW25039.1 hypothetical protein B4Q04_10845 [Zobellia sp. OII3]